MILKKYEIELLKKGAEILEPMLTRRIEELKETIYKAEPEFGERMRGRALELDRWRGIIRDLINPPKTGKPDSNV